MAYKHEAEPGGKGEEWSEWKAAAHGTQKNKCGKIHTLFKAKEMLLRSNGVKHTLLEQKARTQ